MNIGVIPASHMNFDGHIKNIYSVAYHIRNTAKIKRKLSYDTVKTLMHAFATPQIYSNNTLFLPNFLIQHLQCAINSGRVIACSRKFDHITPLLIELHWLTAEQRIIFKISSCAFKVANGLAPS